MAFVYNDITGGMEWVADTSTSPSSTLSNPWSAFLPQPTIPTAPAGQEWGVTGYESTDAGQPIYGWVNSAGSPIQYADWGTGSDFIQPTFRSSTQANPDFSQYFEAMKSSLTASPTIQMQGGEGGTPTVTGYGLNSWWTDPTGTRWSINPIGGAWDTLGRQTAPISGFGVIKDTGRIGDSGYANPVDVFDPYGAYQGTNYYMAHDSNDFWDSIGIMAAAMLGGAAAGGAFGAGAAGAGGAGAGAAGAGAGAGVMTAAEVAAMDAALAGSLAPYAAGAGAAGAVGGAGGFIGEGAASGIGAWDAALANAPSWTAAGGYGGTGLFNAAQDSQAANVAIDAAGGPGTALQGYQSAGIPSVTVNGAPGGSWWDSLTNALTPSPGSTASNALSSLTGGGGTGSNLLGLGSTLLGGLSGAQGQQGSTSSTRQMDPRLDQPVYGAGGLVPRTQETLASQYPMAQQYGGQLMSTGSNLLGQTAPTTATNPYLSSITDDMQRRTQELLGENNRMIQGNAIGVGGAGGSRQGVAQGMAASRAADSLQGQIANLYGQAYNQDQSRLRQDWTIGSGLLNQGQQMQFAPMQSTSNIYQPFTGFGTTTSNADSGGGWQGAVGGLLSGAALGRQMGWW